LSTEGSRTRKPRRSIAGGAWNGGLFLLKALCVLLMIATPLAGVWIASSLAAFSNGATWLPVAAGFLLFPGLPAAWEMWAAARSRKRSRPPMLTISDRIILRTLAVNITFLVVLLWAFPTRAFVALSARGDWMLEGKSGPAVDRTRHTLLRCAEGLEWLYNAAHENPYRKQQEEPTPTPSASTAPTASVAPLPTPEVRPAPSASTAPTASATPLPTGEPPPVPPSSSSATPAPATEPAPVPVAQRYPWPATVHPLVANMPSEVETSPESVARYIAEREPDRMQRVKALHDWVADRVAYDAPAYLAHNIPHADADARTVFRTRLAVCAGYADLLALLGRLAGEEILYVTGDARSSDSPMEAEGHAWNAARVDGTWYLLDPTWDAGGVSGSEFKKEYDSEFLFTPPQVFVVTHFPDKAKWQLLETPVSRVDFFRRPVLSPTFFAHGLELLEPDRSQVSSGASIDLRLKNPNGVYLLADYTPKGSRGRTECEGDGHTAIHCGFTSAGSYDVRLFVNPTRSGTYAFGGSVEVNAKP
jgi:hypothetical protein